LPDELTTYIESLKEENMRLCAENKKLARELRLERNAYQRNKVRDEARENLNKIISAEKYRLEKYMNLLLANCPDLIMFFDRDGHLTLASDSYLRRCRIPVLAMISGKTYRELISPVAGEDFLRRLDDVFREALSENRSLEIDHDIDFGMEGDVRHYFIHVIPMIAEAGVAEGAMLLFYDTTEITRAKLAAERARELAEQSTRAKSDFLSRMSHEIRTPMNAIMGMTELLLRKNISPDAREDAMGIKHAGDNLLTIINDILDFSKIESGRMDIIPAGYTLTSMINDVISIIRMRIVEKPIQFVVNVNSRIPDKLVGDELRIRQILLNLLSNAAKYTHSGHIRFTVDGVPDGPDRILLRCSISDTGIGIREEDMGKLFIDFSQIDTYRNRMIEGTGLGLSIAQNLCRLMGGRITAESVYGTGSNFTAVIPQSVADPAPFAAVADPEGKSALVYEPRQICALSITDSLKDLGVRNKSVSDAEAFRRELAEGGYRYAFISSHVYEKVRDCVAESADRTTPVIMAEVDKVAAADEFRTLAMPVYSAPLANVLNGEWASRGYHERKDIFIDFVAPNARILIVDDIETNLKVVTGLMSPYKMQMDCCRSGVEAIALIQENRYDLALIDHMMPNMDGIETANAIRRLPGDYYRDVPLIAFTANAMTGMREMFLEKGFNDYLTKPIETVKLNEIMEAWIPVEKRQKAGYEEKNPPDLLGGRQVEGVDLEACRKRYYDDDSCIQIIRSYCVHTPAILEKLRTISERTLKDYAVTVHGLKGANYGICAIAAARDAETLELAAKAGDFETVRRNNGAFVESIEGLLDNLNALMADVSTDISDKPSRPYPDRCLLEKLLDASARFMVDDMEDIMEEIELYRYEDGSELVAWLRKQVDNLEYDAIKKCLEGQDLGAPPQTPPGGTASWTSN
jgi:signal transduction histidine kinase/CheY-like chemotaxis protein